MNGASIFPTGERVNNKLSLFEADQPMSERGRGIFGYVKRELIESVEERTLYNGVKEEVGISGILFNHNIIDIKI